MSKCINCNHEQYSGKFCEVCGKPLENKQVEVKQETKTTSPVSGSSVENTEKIAQTTYDQSGAAVEQIQQPNQNAESVKKALGEYWSYFLRMLKNPTNAFTANENYFVNGLITIGLYILLFSFAFYFYANSVVRSIGFMGETMSIPFSINFRLILLMLIVIAIAFFSAFAMIKAVKNLDSFKTLLAQFGGLLVPFTLLNAVALIGGIIGSLFLTIVPILISLTYMISYLPVLFVYEKASQLKTSGHKVYVSLVTVLIIAILFYILGEALLADLIEQIENLNPTPSIF